MNLLTVGSDFHWAIPSNHDYNGANDDDLDADNGGDGDDGDAVSVHEAY